MRRLKETEVRKKPLTKPKKAPICHILNPLMPMAARMPNMVFPKNQPTTQPIKVPIKVLKRTPKKSMTAVSSA